MVCSALNVVLFLPLSITQWKEGGVRMRACMYVCVRMRACATRAAAAPTPGQILIPALRRNKAMVILLTAFFRDFPVGTKWHLNVHCRHTCLIPSSSFSGDTPVPFMMEFEFSVQKARIISRQEIGLLFKYCCFISYFSHGGI